MTWLVVVFTIVGALCGLWCGLQLVIRKDAPREEYIFLSSWLESLAIAFVPLLGWLVICLALFICGQANPALIVLFSPVGSILLIRTWAKYA